MKSVLPAALLVICAVSPSLAHAQNYPNKTIRMIVPFPAGGATDIVARLVAQKLGDAMGQQVIVDNRGGAAGTIGSDLAAKSPPDGYTILIGTSSTHAIAQSLYAKLPYDSVRDFAPVIGIATATIVLSMHPSVPAKTVKELIALAKSKPDALSFASSGSGACRTWSAKCSRRRRACKCCTFLIKATHRRSRTSSAARYRSSSAPRCRFCRTYNRAA
jgi:tripartite-type tricarboxylate transporter receptor subunit TctC